MCWGRGWESPKWNVLRAALYQQPVSNTKPSKPLCVHLKGTDTAQSGHFLHQNVGFCRCSKTAKKEIVPHKTPRASLWKSLWFFLCEVFTWILCLVSPKAEITCLRSLLCLRGWDPSTVLGKIHGSICNCICWFYLFFSGYPVFNERGLVCLFFFFFPDINFRFIWSKGASACEMCSFLPIRAGFKT